MRHQYFYLGFLTKLDVSPFIRLVFFLSSREDATQTRLSFVRTVDGKHSDVALSGVRKCLLSRQGV